MLFTSDFGDGDDHYHWDLPMLVAGHAGGRWKPGRHISYPHRGGGGPSNKTDMPMANLFVSVLQAFDLPATTFGTDGQQPYGTTPPGRAGAGEEGAADHAPSPDPLPAATAGQACGGG